MRAETVRPSTWLLGAIAGWAMLVWVLALAGLGHRIEQLPADPSLAQPLPPLPSAAAPALGPLAQYTEFSNRPLLNDDRRPHAFLLKPEGETQQETFKFVLTSVLLTPGLQMAIVQPEGGGPSIRLRVGEAPDTAPSYPLVSLTPRGAVFTGPDGDRTLDLRVFNGVGGEPPTSVRTPSVAAGAAGERPIRPTATVPAPPPPPMSVNPAAPTPAHPPAPVVTTVPNAPAMTGDAQVEEIRKRIEARRALLRAQSQPPPAPEQTK